MTAAVVNLRTHKLPIFAGQVVYHPVFGGIRRIKRNDTTLED